MGEKTREDEEHSGTGRSTLRHMRTRLPKGWGRAVVAGQLRAVERGASVTTKSTERLVINPEAQVNWVQGRIHLSTPQLSSPIKSDYCLC